MNRPAARSSQLAILSLFLGSCAVVGQSPSTSVPGAPGATGAPRSPARARGPVFEGNLTLAGGRYRHDTDGVGDDRTRASLVGVRLEGATPSGIGGGVSLEFTGSDDDLFEDQGTPTQAASADIAPYFLWRAVQTPRFRMPLRAGPWIQTLVLEDQNTDDTTTWVTGGLRLELEPEVVLISNRTLELLLHSRLTLAGGGTWIEVDSPGNDDEYESSAGAFGFEFGPRLRWSHFQGGVFFLHRSMSIDESDRENGVRIPEQDNSFNAVAFSFGGRF
ncbi:MAG: hypothetical protein IPK67_05740 [Planctomycetes bacterium]|nr:hypothetical protein [Planctomycetota bacterium]